MKKPKFKIRQHLMDKIVRAAKELPPMAKADGKGQPVYKDTIVHGSQLTSKDLKPGTPLDPNARYRIKVLQYEDHQLNMVKLAQEQGEQAVDDYIGAVQFQYEAAVKEAKAANTVWARLKTQIINLKNKFYVKKSS